MGRKLSFEDVRDQQLDEYIYECIREESYDCQGCFAVELNPKDEDSGYTKAGARADKQHYCTLKVDFSDRKTAI